ncbi:mannose/fructose/sorbose PTS transporter subunit IIA [Bacillus sp. V3-13]|uniref:mannose/fructose/sorbose PTS transporter subunit IIA n=1 Tax=Bacillus sp. V3-13 TaxID=2053728 RepID=UPI001C6109A1|nr:mannose/fructose/sorbose PTS transporter subunit IIA [Bacillus sp. V3-13]
MTTAIIIGTHGASAEQLLRSTEMIIGPQENVTFIDFVPGENTDTLITKFNEQLSKLDTAAGVLFMVDLFGGSPYNAASQIALPKPDYDVIAGVNIPMLLETLALRSGMGFDELVDTALKAGSMGVKSLRRSLVVTEESEEEL